MTSMISYRQNMLSILHNQNLSNLAIEQNKEVPRTFMNFLLEIALNIRTKKLKFIWTQKKEITIVFHSNNNFYSINKFFRFLLEEFVENPIKNHH